MNYLEIYKSTESYVSELFARHATAYLFYHNLKHTVFVVDRCKEIAGNYHINEKDMLVLIIAAWFHDTGYLFTTPQLHEEKSVEILTAFMKTIELDEIMIKKAATCIMATKQPRDPQNLLEEIICDADTYNLGTKKFKKTNNQIFEEWKIMHPGLKRKDFDASTIVLLEQHEYYTNYCKAILQHTKKMTLDKLKKKQSESKNNTRDEDKGETEIDKKAEELHWLKTWFRLPIVKPGSVNQCRMLPGKPILYTFNLT